jgi:hypothetical protein
MLQRTLRMMSNREDFDSVLYDAKNRAMSQLLSASVQQFSDLKVKQAIFRRDGASKWILFE